MATIEEREETRSVAALLGGKKVLRREITDAYQMLDAVRKGLPFRAFEALTRSTELQLKQVSVLIGVPNRTLARRKVAKQLNASESDRLYRVAHVITLARVVLGTLRKAKVWLLRPNRALGGVIPLNLLDTDIGVRQVEEVLGRIEHGIYS